MSQHDCFPHLVGAVAADGQQPDELLTSEGLVRLICHDCDFYKEDDRQLECAAFRLLRLLLLSGRITIEDVVAIAQTGVS